jgi:hypothetical protein
MIGMKNLVGGSGLGGRETSFKAAEALLGAVVLERPNPTFT